MGNVRLTFSDLNQDGAITVGSIYDATNEIVFEKHYYPFGLDMTGAWFATVAPDNTRKYNQKEWDEAVGLYDYGARYYDPALARWGQVDALADHPNQVDKSPYAYAWNDPISLNDPDGNCPTCAFAGGVVGGLLGGGVEIGRQLWNEGGVSNWNAVKGSAAHGLIVGAATGFTGGASLGTTVTVGGVSNVAGGAANRYIQGKETTLSDVGTDAAIGAGLGALGWGAGKIVEHTMNKLSPAAKGKIGEAITEVKYGAQGYRSSGKAKVPTGGTTKTGRTQTAHYDHDMTNVFTGSRRTVESKFNRARLSRNQRAASGNIKTQGGLILDRTTPQQFGGFTTSIIMSGGIQVLYQNE